MWIESYTVAYQ